MRNPNYSAAARREIGRVWRWSRRLHETEGAFRVRLLTARKRIDRLFGVRGLSGATMWSRQLQALLPRWPGPLRVVVDRRCRRS